MIAMPTTPAARVLPRRSSTAVIGEQRTAYDDLRKQKLHQVQQSLKSSHFGDWPRSPQPRTSEHREQTIWATHMLHANDDKICFTAPQIAFDLRDPIAVSDIDETPAQRWKIAKRFLKHTIKASDAVKCTGNCDSAFAVVVVSLAASR